MNIPNLPFDNLYKFLAVFGLVLIGYGMFFILSFKDNIYSEANSIDKRKSQFNNEISTLEPSERTLKHEQDSISISYAIKLMRRKIDAIPSNLTLFASALILGLFCSAFGFIMWHSKFQRHQDEIIKNEAAKYSNEHWVYMNRTKFDKELKIYEELWSSLVQLRNATLNLRTDTDEYKNKPISMNDVDERSKAFFNTHKSTYELFEQNKPFYAKEIYDKTDLVLKICQSEFADFSMGGFSDLKGYWEKARENSDRIVSEISHVEESIRLRLENSEIRSKSS